MIPIPNRDDSGSCDSGCDGRAGVGDGLRGRPGAPPTCLLFGRGLGSRSRSYDRPLALLGSGVWACCLLCLSNSFALDTDWCSEKGSGLKAPAADWALLNGTFLALLDVGGLRYGSGVAHRRSFGLLNRFCWDAGADANADALEKCDAIEDIERS